MKICSRKLTGHRTAVLGTLVMGAVIFATGQSNQSSEQSPVSHFRTILLKEKSERESFVIRQTPPVQSVLRRKIKEYEAMPATEREFRLTATELHYYLDPIFVDNRPVSTQSISGIPPHLKVYANRAVGFWNQLETAHRDLLLSKKEAVSYLVGISYRSKTLESLTPKPSKEWNGLYHFLLLSEENQEKFCRYHGLQISPEMNELLGYLNKLDMEKRKRCAHAFVCYLSFPSDLKNRFQSGVNDWAAKKPYERSIWREIAGKYPKINPVPFPPGMQSAAGQQAATKAYPPFPTASSGSKSSGDWQSSLPPLPPGLK